MSSDDFDDGDISDEGPDELTPDEDSDKDEDENFDYDAEEEEPIDYKNYGKGDTDEEEEEERKDPDDEDDDYFSEEEKVYYPIDIFQRRRFFKGYNHPPIDNWWCWCHPRNCPCICNDKFVRGSKSSWYFFIKLVGVLEFHAINITIILNFLGYCLFVILVSITGYNKLYETSIIPSAPYVYYGMIPQVVFLCLIPPISYFLKFIPLYYVSDEYRRQCIRWFQYFFFSYFINAYTVLSASGFFGSLGVFKLIRCVLYLFNRGENIEIEFGFFMVMLVINLAVIIGYTISFLSNVWVTTGFCCMLFTICERPYSSKPYKQLGEESEDDDDEDNDED